MLNFIFELAVTVATDQKAKNEDSLHLNTRHQEKQYNSTYLCSWFYLYHKENFNISEHKHKEHEKIKIQMASVNSEPAHQQLLWRTEFVWRRILDSTVSQKFLHSTKKMETHPMDFELYLYWGDKNSVKLMKHLCFSL